MFNREEIESRLLYLFHNDPVLAKYLGAAQELYIRSRRLDREPHPTQDLYICTLEVCYTGDARDEPQDVTPIVRELEAGGSK